MEAFMARISELHLITPALYLIHKKPGITTGELIVELRNIFKPVGEDAELLHGRNDDKFSQIVRNLVSHHTLDHRLGYSILEEGTAGTYTHSLTEQGLNYLKENLSSLESLLSNDLGYLETLNGINEINNSQSSGKKVFIFDENVFILEGRRKSITSQVYERSKTLREKAIESYTHDGKIVCEVCGFDFYKSYGEIGRGFIEIHHQKPIFQYEETDFSKVVTEALKQLIPLCSNCHRMIHRSKDAPLTIQELRAIVKT